MTWEQRWHPLRREWVVISTHRDQRPWLGQTMDGNPDPLPSYVEDCYLCPGNRRASGRVNDEYRGIFAFDNDHPCVGPDAPTELEPPPGIHRNRPASGLARVVCYSPRHDLALSQLPAGQVEALLGTWQAQYRQLGARAEVNHVLIFENKGEVVGVSNPHPHCQIYATNFLFRTIEVECEAAAGHVAKTGRVLFQDIIAAEKKDGRRIVAENAGAISFVPYFARYPYETFVAPKATHGSLAELDVPSLRAFAAVLRETLIRFDNLWKMPFPYVLVLHQQPTDGREHPGFHFHTQIHPPLRRPNLMKYLAGPEIGGGNFLNDTAPEDGAEQLRAVSATHYNDPPA